MSGFYVGQRVRIIRSDLSPRFVGKTATVHKIDTVSMVFGVDQPGCGVDVDGIGDHYTGAPIGFPFAWLEPIEDDDSRTVIAWSECVFKPKGVAV